MTEDTAKKDKAQTPTSVAELDGDNVEVIQDFSRIQALIEKPLALVFNGHDVEKALPEWKFAWFTPKDAYNRSMIGYRKVVDVPELRSVVKAPSQPEDDRKTAKDIRISDGGTGYMSAYCIPRRQFEAYDAFIQKERVTNTEGELGDVAMAEAVKHATGTSPSGGAGTIRTHIDSSRTALEDKK